MHGEEMENFWAQKQRLLFSQGHWGCPRLGEFFFKINNGLKQHRPFCYLTIFSSQETDSLLLTWATELSDLSDLTLVWCWWEWTRLDLTELPWRRETLGIPMDTQLCMDAACPHYFHLKVFACLWLIWSLLLQQQREMSSQQAQTLDNANWGNGRNWFVAANTDCVFSCILWALFSLWSLYKSCTGRCCVPPCTTVSS